jgi:hypothetical protein
MERVRFDIRLGERPPYSSNDPPADPLHEFTAAELGLWRYCFEHNRLVAFTLGNDPLDVVLDLDTDFSTGLPDRIPALVGALAAGASVCFLFPASSLELTLAPEGPVTHATVRKYGNAPLWYREATLVTAQVVATWRQFLSEVVSRAANLGYLSPTDATAILAPAL